MAAPTTLARRYAPFLLLAAVQVLLVAVVPSTGTSPGTGVAAGSFDPGAAGTGVGGEPLLDPATGQIIDPTTGAPIATGGSASGSGANAGTAAGRPGGTSGVTTGGARPGATAATGDRSKCAKDGVRQQDVTISSPPCVPKFVGDNGGATYQGVTATEVKVIRYRPKANAIVENILRAQGLASTPEEEEAAMQAFAKFFEKRYEFYGRKINWISVQGTCEISPPDIACFRDEVKRLNAQHKPLAVFWTSATTQAEFFEQWSQLGVVNLGGWHFNQGFNVANRPFHYDLFMDGTRTARNVADYWCKKMQGKPASLAGDPAMRTTRRKVGIITQDFAVTRKNALDFVAMVTGGMCGSRVDASDPVYTPSDITRSQQTASTAIQKLKAEGVTTLVIMSDPIGPVFFTGAARDQQWSPEYLLAGSGLIDYDVLGRLYDQTQWANAFGPGHLAEPIPFAQSDAAKAAADVGVSNVYAGANLMFGYMSLVANQVQMAGPKLTPASVEQATLTLPPTGGWERTKNPAAVLVKFGKDDYTAFEDSRHTYWSPTATSKIDGGVGAYLPIEGGRRFEIGAWPGGEPKK